ncbi:hydantoinase/carbamoylase family amidase [Plastoroseomonas hellenica]|uniref:Hydantoinase/carbamoylase family amidase n=1 Tax=Plastoroseomonas hellenica TaxID=2687306 RepID=A0ABS5F0U0_9PROT|nr:hydantoinase/carbamoylase family amidase [Plastoroseomonas hellenica]MBR0644883.1 hydantoinase/carbamoylase family amidase [Plastoroseomonas hellenica]MBR0666162.1 hydantoinase/carbamoylase family amidase [Plastoroseomonas hellenica]
MTLPNLAPDVELAARLFDTLRERSFDGVGITREAYGPGERMAHALVRAEAEALGLEARSDPVGNLYLTLPGTDRAAKRVVLGSHLDSVQQGGNFDGAAGVLAGLATVAGMKRAGFVPGRDVTVMAIRAEEAGAWFPTSYPGSRGALGLLKPEELQVKRMDSGRTLAEHMREEGFDPGFVEAGKRELTPDNTAAFVELHIEQGPVLEAEGLPVGIVTGIPGSRRLRAARVLGEYNHSGGTPRKYRRDAAIALAELAAKLDEYWCELDAQGRVLVCTFCTMATTAEAGFTKIAGEAEFMLDVRSVDVSNCDLMFDRLHALVAAIEARRGVRFELGAEGGSKASPMDAGVQAGLLKAAASLGISHKAMASGGGHDAAAFAQAGIPAGMVFVRNQNGSHNPREAMRIEDFAAATAVVSRFVQDISQ